MKKIQWIPVLLLPVSCFALSVLTFSTEVGFTWKMLAQAAFWRRYIMTTACTYSAYIAAQYARHQSNLARKDYVERETAIRAIVSKVGTDMTEFLAEYNTRKKRRMYRQAMDDKIAALRIRRAKIAEKGTLKEEARKRLVQFDTRIGALAGRRDMVTAADVESIRVKHYKPLRRISLYGIEAARRDYDQEIVSVDVFYARKSIQRLVIGMAIAFLLTAVTVNPIMSLDRAALMLMVTNLYSILIAVFSGVKGADAAFERVITANQTERINILQQYEAWRKHEA